MNQNTPRGWRLSTKLTLAYSLLILLVSAALTASLYLQLRTAQRQAIRARLEDILSFAAPQIDGDYHSLILAPQDSQGAFYATIDKRLQTIAGTSAVIRRLYTLRQQPDGTLVYVFDQAAAAGSAVGASYASGSPLLAQGLGGISGPVVEEGLITDASGRELLRGFVPIYDQSQRLEGVLGIEIDASVVRASGAQAATTAAWAFAATVPLALLLGWWLARRLTAPVTDLVGAATQVAQGELDQAVPVRSADELGDLALAFNTMARSLRERIAAEQTTQQDLRASNTQMQSLLDLVRDLETPVIPLLRGVLVVPLVGYIDTRRAARLTELVLAMVHQQRARMVLIDITGISTFDSGVARNITQMALAIQLLGARAILTGIKAEVAQTMVALGLDFSAIQTAARLEDGVALVLGAQG